MNIDLEMLAKLRQLDERQLAEAILTLAEAAGADEKQKKAPARECWVHKTPHSNSDRQRASAHSGKTDWRK